MDPGDLPRASNIIIGISGPSCSGKTTISKLIHSALEPHTILLHEDDFYKPDAEIPNKKLPDGRSLADWDCAEAIDVDRLAETLRKFKDSGKVEGVKSIQDQQAEGSKSEIDPDSLQTLSQAVKEAHAKAGAPKILLLDGFLLHGSSVPQLQPIIDVKLLLAASYEAVKARREARKGYVTIEGFWDDPEGYVDEIVWPNYVAEHKFMFEEGDFGGEEAHTCVPSELNINICKGNEMETVGKAFDWTMRQIEAALCRL